MNEEEQHEEQYTRRDGETLKVLGAFMGVLAIPVIIGTVWADSFVHGVVCLICGILLLGFSVGFWLRGKHTLNKLK